jgi:enterochelin esterase-like enzyme
MNTAKKQLILLPLFVIALSACATNPAPTATAQPTPTISAPTCTEQGTLGDGEVPNPTQGFPISFQYYLPPCYESQTRQFFPVLYLVMSTGEVALSATGNTPASLTERLIHNGKMPPVILIFPSLPVGYGSDAALTKDLVPYVDGQFRTRPYREYRGVGGISHGAAIAVRMAFQFPDQFSRAGLLSGGLAKGEEERFAGWVQRTPPERWPRVAIYVGEQDGIMKLTENLLPVLDKHRVPYALNIEPGDHNWVFWSAHMESYLLWMSQDW